jgi:pimeloyl-ACP methyl ester carboxylesterase
VEWILTVLIVGFLSAAAWTGSHYWKQRTVARLNAGSKLLETARGVLEYAILNDQSDEPKLPILVIHGTPGGYDQGLVLSSYIFAQNQKVIAVSRPGYLRTPLRTGETPEDQADAYAGRLYALNVRQVIVFAIAGGGPSALQFALRHPERTAALILASATTQAIDIAINDVPALLASAVGSWLSLHGARFMPALLDKTIAHEPTLRGPALLLAQTSFPLDRRLPGWRNDAEQYRVLPRYAFEAIRCPTLVIHGTADDNVPFAHAQAAANAIPKAQLIAIEGGQHIFSVLNRDAVQHIRDFVRAYADVPR